MFRFLKKQNLIKFTGTMKVVFYFKEITVLKEKKNLPVNTCVVYVYSTECKGEKVFVFKIHYK